MPIPPLGGILVNATRDLQRSRTEARVMVAFRQRIAVDATAEGLLNDFTRHFAVDVVDGNRDEDLMIRELETALAVESVAGTVAISAATLNRIRQRVMGSAA